MKTEIKEIRAWEIIDSRGMPTVCALARLKGEFCASASVPSGASTGKYEAHEKRDGDKNRYLGKGVLGAIKSVNEVIAPSLVGKSFTQRELDTKLSSLDKSPNKSNLGANATLGVSLAFANACAKQYSMMLYKYIGGALNAKMPIPLMNIINGGAHASNNLDIQEFMIAPVGFDTFSQALRAGCEVYHSLKKLLLKRGLSVAVGDEGGFAPNLSSETEAIELIIEAIAYAGYDTDTVKIALDIAASEWHEGDKYVLPKSGEELSTSDLIARWDQLISKYPIISIEDPLGEDDESGWKMITEELGSRVMLVGDDLFVTNPKIFEKHRKNGIANAILIKPNQIGTLTETLDVIADAKSSGYKIILSHRSGETTDTSIADIAVGVGAQFIKAGAPCRGERIAKYNRLLEIEGEIYSI